MIVAKLERNAPQWFNNGMKEKNKPDLDPVAEVILDLVSMCRPGQSITPDDAAREFAGRQWAPADPPPGEWRVYLQTAKQQALFLARSGRIEILRKGQPADLTKPVKGLFRLGKKA